MGEGQFALFGEHLAAALLAAFVWLFVCRMVWVLRRRPGVSYLIASLLVVLSCSALSNGLTPAGLTACVIVLAILYVFYKRALRRRSFEASTIISYESHDIF